ncbi:MAG: hypothetical protein ABI776_18375 [Nocardioidaceae bacterium]
MDQRVYLHVGVHKSGTPHLQSRMARSGAALREQGVLYPAAGSQMFLSAVDVRDTCRAWGLRRRDVRGSWDRLCRTARHHDGVTVISHELFAGAAPRQVVAAMTMLRGVDVHVVVSTPDQEHPTTVETVNRWGRAVPPSRLHVLCAPTGPTGHPQLWQDFADLVGFDPARTAPRATID